MEINAGQVPVYVNSISSTSTVASPAEEAGSKPNDVVKPEIGKDQLQPNKDIKELTNDEIGQVTDGLNKFMETINTDLKFEIHEKTNRVIVQVVDSKDQRVIKEFPPHELLDTLAAISDYVGVLLDKKV
ncbi:flagellar protein FlaG [Desulfosporosinus sp.]|uniref:flagellar protein FlaG n=1 Tax=Desulfosporosinus sp. TaxID=157907 RepID=UPI0025BD3C9A|nr:flagellar protein FlaG [Desulfosporosinus sp.]MBC2723828.1 flagellar protein FlaG [Desulfosporosinus sp.]MBC2728845.1 flagellar protein FlaG [Desulfosporosinus sp.]